MRYLGIDYGKRWVGLAIADTRVNVVLPMEAIENKGEEKLLTQLNDIIKGEKIDEIVIGMPYSLNSQKSAQTKETIDFAKKLAAGVKVPVREEDERLTSQSGQIGRQRLAKKRECTAMPRLCFGNIYFEKNL